MYVAGEKSKLLIIGTKKLRDLNLSQPIEIQVDGKKLRESRSEKFLGVVINNKLTWQEHLHGENWREGNSNAVGLIPQFSQRVGILKRLSKFMTRKRLKLFSQGIQAQLLSASIRKCFLIGQVQGHQHQVCVLYQRRQ